MHVIKAAARKTHSYLGLDLVRRRYLLLEGLLIENGGVFDCISGE